MMPLMLLRHWKLGLAALLLLALGIQTLRLNASVTAHSRTKAELAKVEAAIKYQSALIEAWKRAAESRQREAEAALKLAQRNSARVEVIAREAEKPVVVSGRCEVPASARDAIAELQK